GHAGPVPVQFSAASHSPAEARHTVKLDRKASGGQALLVPSHVSSTSHGPAIGRQTAPAFPAGCWQASSVPSQVSVVHALPSSVHGVPPGDLSSGGQAGPVPVQLSAGSHSPAEGRQTTVEGSKASAGQVGLVPLQVSSTSHGPVDARHTVPAFPAGCWQASFVPSQVSVVHALPSPVQREPADFFASGGHGCPGSPPHVSATSHSPAAGRQAKTFGRTTSGGHVELSPSQTSSGSHASPEPVRQTVPAFPAACWQASFVPSQVSVVHALPLACFASAGQLGPLPVQLSAWSHSPAAGRQTVLEDAKPSAGHVLLAPVHVSATSHTPAAGRHTAPALPAGC